MSKEEPKMTWNELRNERIDHDLILSAEPCAEEKEWLEDHPNATWDDVPHSAWLGWAAVDVFETIGDVSRADVLYALSDRPAYWRGEGAVEAERQGDTARADALYALSGTPDWQGEGALVAERLGDVARADVLYERSGDAGWRNAGAVEAARRGNTARANALYAFDVNTALECRDS